MAPAPPRSPGPWVVRYIVWLLPIGIGVFWIVALTLSRVERGRATYRAAQRSINRWGFRPSAFPRPRRAPDRWLFDFGWWWEEGQHEKREYQEWVEEHGTEPLPRTPDPEPDPSWHTLFATIIGGTDEVVVRNSFGDIIRRWQQSVALTEEIRGMGFDRVDLDDFEDEDWRDRQ